MSIRGEGAFLASLTDGTPKFVEDFVEHVPFPGQGPGREGLRYAAATYLSAFPDMEWSLEEQIAEGEKVVSRFTMSGTQRGVFLGIPPTGKIRPSLGCCY
jgi:predicted ester cyclase